MASLIEFADYDENLIAAPQLIGNPADYGITDDEETDDEGEEDEDDEDYVPGVATLRVSHDTPPTVSSDNVIVIPDESQDCVEEERNKRRRFEGGEASCSFATGSSNGSQGNDHTDIDGLFCPICMDVWTNNGEHHICCLPCGHIYGMSCIKRWLQQRKNSSKCPQCNRKCTLKDVRKLFASRVVAVEEESQKRIQSLEAKCAALESKVSDWRKKEEGWKFREITLHSQVQTLTQKEIHLDGARVFDMDISNQIVLIAQKPKEVGGMHLLTKMSLLSPFEMQDILLPSATSGVKDLHISPSNSSMALFSSLGKKLSVLSLDSGNLVINYDLQDPAWSCSWDLNNSHNIYAGLQNGSVLVFDMRQTVGPVKSLVGLTNNPVHTVTSLAQTSSLSSSVKTILSASAFGLCQWNIDSEERPLVVPETDNQGVCISLAYCPSSDDIVASYRPKFNMSMDVPLSQPLATPLIAGQGVQGTHVLFNRMGSHHFQKVGSSHANVSKIRLPKCVIMDVESQSRLLASWDEVTCDLVLHELPSFRLLQQFKMPAQARDLRYSHSHGVLGCLSENTLQLFYSKHSSVR
ncbi:E3 ubiquitin-protein ligase RFWD3 isoform X2 [Vigna unguiculata]|uniref:E3 ubiquitin-protein ligase RFWD3 isoform X2 n=1 Tax=Vigna unguiculata TaxID=3917 RepID=UPI00101648C4|nr:E3 ubiquitin-protein ligase RFWD3 isoform X2 [Vigna unguiculata]